MGHKLSLAAASLLTALALLAPAGAKAAAPLLAPASVCPRTELNAPAASQEEEMLCLANYARAQIGAQPLEPASALEESARDKARDILRCDSFSHYACGREFTYWMRASGYLEGCWHAGENLAYGVGVFGTAVSIFRAWLRSPTHRANLFGEYTQTGIDLKVGRLEGSPGVHIWAEHFGTRC